MTPAFQLIHGKKRECSKCRGMSGQALLTVAECDCVVVNLDVTKPVTPDTMVRGWLLMSGIPHVRLVWDRDTQSRYP